MFSGSSIRTYGSLTQLRCLKKSDQTEARHVSFVVLGQVPYNTLLKNLLKMGAGVGGENMF